jgi:hypothetical protein
MLHRPPEPLNHGDTEDTEVITEKGKKLLGVLFTIEPFLRVASVSSVSPW